MVFSEDFNTGTAGEWPDGRYPDNGVWEIGIPTVGPSSCFDVNQCAGTVLDAYYPDYIDSRLISPSLTLPPISPDEQLQLRFQHWFAYAGGSYGRVEISELNVDGSWPDWAIVGGPYGVSYDWIGESVDLSHIPIKKVSIGFAHIADGNNSWGWYIDAHKDKQVGRDRAVD